jgi:hypothetical protein
MNWILPLLLLLLPIAQARAQATNNDAMDTVHVVEGRTWIVIVDIVILVSPISLELGNVDAIPRHLIDSSVYHRIVDDDHRCNCHPR